MDDTHTRELLGLDEFKPTQELVCFLPFRGEFGWYLTTYVKRFHAFNHENKIACIKHGHECLFPSAKHFFYDWQDIDDTKKMGIIPMTDEEAIKEKVKKQFATDNIFFSSATDAGWLEKTSLSGHVFVPKSINNFGLKADVAITPRFRKIETSRNFQKEYWQYIVNLLVGQEIFVAVCGQKDTSFDLEYISYKAYDHVDVDSDVEIMNNAKLVISQETGILYLSFLCKRPTLVTGLYMGGDVQRDLSVPFCNATCDKQDVVIKAFNFLRKGTFE